MSTKQQKQLQSQWLLFNSKVGNCDTLENTSMAHPVKWTSLEAFLVGSLISAQPLSFLLHSAEPKVNCPYVQGQSSSVLLFLYCEANILKFPSLSLSPFLFLILWSFHRASFTYHIVLRPSFFAQHFIQALLCSSLGISTMIGHFQRRRRILSSSHLRSFCLLSYWAVKKNQMR